MSGVVRKCLADDLRVRYDLRLGWVELYLLVLDGRPINRSKVFNECLQGISKLCMYEQ